MRRETSGPQKAGTQNWKRCLSGSDIRSPGSQVAAATVLGRIWWMMSFLKENTMFLLWGVTQAIDPKEVSPAGYVWYEAD